MTRAETSSDLGWSDVYFHLETDAPVAVERVPEILSQLKAQAIELAVGHDGPDLWDDPDEPNMVFEKEDVPVDALGPALEETANLEHLSLVLDPAEVGVLPLMAECQDGSWQVHLCSLTWGHTTLPDFTAQKTSAAFRLGLALGGPGLPDHPAEYAAKLQENPMVCDWVAQLSKVFGGTCTVTLACGE